MSDTASQDFEARQRQEIFDLTVRAETAEREREQWKATKLHQRRAEKFDHVTNCAIWGDDGQGNLEGSPTKAPCSCGALENWFRHKFEEAERERDAAIRQIDEEQEHYVNLQRITDARITALEAVAKVWEDGGHGLIGHYARGDHQYSGIHVACWLRDFVAALQPAKAPPMLPVQCKEPRCPTCSGVLQEVRYPEDSMLNREQFDSVRAGDYYCTVCKGTEAKSGYKYWWKSELTAPAPDPVREAVEPQYSTGDVVGRDANPMYDALVCEVVAERTRACAKAMCRLCNADNGLFFDGDWIGHYTANGKGVERCEAMELRRAYPECFQMGVKKDEKA